MMISMKKSAIVSFVAVWHGAVLSASAAGVIGVDGSPLSGAFDPTKCRIDRSDDQFKSNEIGGQCARCVTNDQCRHAYGGFGWYCCPFMKRCVNSGSMGCYDTAFCKPRCFGEKYPELKKECSGCDSSFPDNWVKGCTRDDWPSLVAGVGGPDDEQRQQPRPVPQPVARPNVGGGGGNQNNNRNGAPAPDWCEWCLEDVLPSDRCVDYKVRLNWCAGGPVRTMREQCSRSCGYCDGCPAGTAAKNKLAKDSMPTMKPTAFDGVGPKCRPNRKFTGDTEFRTACGDWGRQGYCEKHPDLMHRDCAETCGFCEYPGRANQGNNNNQQQRPAVRLPEPESESSSEEQEPRRPGVVGGGNVNRQQPGGGAPAKGACARIGNNGAACQANANCEWDWGLMTCVAPAGSCERIGADGRACNAAPACEWSWADSFCLDAPGAGGNGQSAVLGKCERIGANGEQCARTEGCRWDWDAFSCVEDASARVAPAVNQGRGGKKGKKQRGGSGCAGLNSKKCSRSSSCVLDGRVCRDRF